MNCPVCNAFIPEGESVCRACGASAASAPKTAPSSQNPYAGGNPQGYAQQNPYQQNPYQQPYQQPYQSNPYQQPYNPYGFNQPDPNDHPDVLFNILSLFVPIIGLITYFLEREKKPKKAKSALTFSIIGWVLSFISGIVIYVIMFAAEMMYYW